jgi:uncharacterized membrane protein YgaE (UPF0421/DUF939 family)
MTNVAPAGPLAGRHALAPAQWSTEWFDRLVGADPGLNRLMKAVEVVLAQGAAFAAEWFFVRSTGALLIGTTGPGLTAAQVATAQTVNHALFLTAIAIGALTAQLTGTSMLEAKIRGQLVTALFVPFPMIAALALGLAVNSHRLLSLVLLAACAGVGAYLRRFGARGARAGVMLFVGFFLGYFLRGAVVISGLGWLSAEIGLGALVGVVIHLVFFAPRHRWALRRTQRSYAARARKTTRLALAVFDERVNPSARRGRQLRRQLIRLNEAALMIDAQLALPGALAAGSSARRLHQWLFDIELALTNVARFAHALGRMDLPDEQRALIRRALIELYQGNMPAARAIGQDLIDLVRVADAANGQGEPADRLAVLIPHRFARSVISLADAMTEWAGDSAGSASAVEAGFQPSVHLAGGWLHGSALVSVQASKERGPRVLDRVRMEPYARVAIQLTVGMAAAIAAGDALSSSRFYWAMLAVYVALIGTNHSGEQSRKAFLRVAGTVVGVVVGIGLADAVGHHTNWTIVVVLAAQFFGFYFQRVNYALFVVGLVTALSQLYVQLGDFSDSLLLTRLAETAVGVAVTVLVVAIVLPLRSGHVGRVAIRHHLAAMASLVAHASGQLLGTSNNTALRTDARALDAAHQALVATIEPLTQNPFGDLDRRAGQFVALTSTYRHYGRALVDDLGTRPVLDEAIRDDLERACQTLNASIDELVRAVDGPRDGAYLRSSALFDRVERHLETQAGHPHDVQLAVRDLTKIDETMAELAAVLTLGVASLDTGTRPGTTSSIGGS